MNNQDYAKAKSYLETILINNPDAPDVLYDTGLAAYKNKEYTQARSYFMRVTHAPQATASLKEQSYFNAGNAAAMMKDYEDAIKHYEEVLRINSANEKAQHNLKKVKELLKQKNDQQQQNKQDPKEKEQKEQKSSEQTEQANNAGNQESKTQKDQQKKNDVEQDTQQQKQQQQADKEQSNPSTNQRDSGHNEHAHNSNNGEQQQQEKEHEKSLEEKKPQSSSQRNGAARKDQGSEKSAALSEKDNLEQKIGDRLARILEAQDKKDAALNKRMVNVAVGQSMSGSQGENCW
jgi:hypothetical protein